MNEITQLVIKERHMMIAPKRYAWNWLKKIAYKLIDYLSLYDDRQYMTHTYQKRVVIDHGKLADAIFNNFYEVYKRTGVEPKYLVIGAREFRLLIDEVNYSITGFQTELKWMEGGRKKFNGMTVIVLPYINGMFCMPDISEIL